MAPPPPSYPHTSGASSPARGCPVQQSGTLNSSPFSYFPQSPSWSPSPVPTEAPLIPSPGCSQSSHVVPHPHPQFCHHEQPLFVGCEVGFCPPNPTVSSWRPGALFVWLVIVTAGRACSTCLCWGKSGQTPQFPPRTPCAACLTLVTSEEGALRGSGPAASPAWGAPLASALLPGLWPQGLALTGPANARVHQGPGGWAAWAVGLAGGRHRASLGSRSRDMDLGGCVAGPWQQGGGEGGTEAVARPGHRRAQAARVPRETWQGPVAAHKSRR